VEQAGVAFFAHLGGFIAGLALVRQFVGDKQLPPRRVYSSEWRRRR